MNKVLVIGGDGFCGWPTSLFLSEQGYDVTIVDNLSRRKIDNRLGVVSLTPIKSTQERIEAWKEVSGKTIKFVELDVAQEFDDLAILLGELRPDAVVHFGEQRSAPYSMRGACPKRYTVDNNINATHNLLAALVLLDLDAHVVHLGTMGVYGYDGAGLEIPEGYQQIMVRGDDNVIHNREILYPSNPGSIYHMTKTMDQLMFQFYAKNDGIRVTDLHQGIVWGTQTDETRRDERLINRFAYDGDYGTVLNRFLMQAAIGYPLTVHGTGGQTRAFVHIRDTVRCVELAISNPPEQGARPVIRNQMTETHRIRELADLVARLTGAKVAMVDNPRKEAAENDLRVSNASFLKLGLNPTTLAEGLLSDTYQVAQKYADRIDRDRVAAATIWTKNQKPGIVTVEALEEGKAHGDTGDVVQLQDTA